MPMKEKTMNDDASPKNTMSDMEEAIALTLESHLNGGDEDVKTGFMPTLKIGNVVEMAFSWLEKIERGFSIAGIAKIKCGSSMNIDIVPTNDGGRRIDFNSGRPAVFCGRFRARIPSITITQEKLSIKLENFPTLHFPISN